MDARGDLDHDGGNGDPSDGTAIDAIDVASDPGNGLLRCLRVSLYPSLLLVHTLEESRAQSRQVNAHQDENVIRRVAELRRRLIAENDPVLGQQERTKVQRRSKRYRWVPRCARLYGIPT